MRRLESIRRHSHAERATMERSVVAGGVNVKDLQSYAGSVYWPLVVEERAHCGDAQEQRGRSEQSSCHLYYRFSSPLTCSDRPSTVTTMEDLPNLAGETGNLELGMARARSDVMAVPCKAVIASGGEPLGHAMPSERLRQAPIVTSSNEQDMSIGWARDENAMVCDICLEPYALNELLAWSRNVDCPHAFHRDCITSWLLRRATCPVCRKDYIATTKQSRIR